MFEEATLYRSSQRHPSKNKTFDNSNLAPSPTVITLLQKAFPVKKANQNLSLHLTQFKTISCWHDIHQCMIHLWIAPGKVKQKRHLTDPIQVENKWFLYIEYKDKSGNNCYVQHSYRSSKDAIVYAETKALTEKLPNC